MRWLIVFLSLSVHAAEVSPWIENGDVVAPSDPLRKSVAQFVFAEGKCSASFISSLSLITAGHCIHEGSVGSALIRLQDARGVWHQQAVRRVLRHPGYRLSYDGPKARVANDFGLIRLAAALDTPVEALPMAEPSSSGATFPVTIAGYGKRSPSTSSSVLRRGLMTAAVQTLPEFGGRSGLYMVAANSRAQATCAGDSGGAVTVVDGRGRLFLIGVHSLSSGCLNDPPAESFSQLPSLVMDWIRANQ